MTATQYVKNELAKKKKADPKKYAEIGKKPPKTIVDDQKKKRR